MYFASMHIIPSKSIHHYKTMYFIAIGEENTSNADIKTSAALTPIKRYFYCAKIYPWAINAEIHDTKVHIL